MSHCSQELTMIFVGRGDSLLFSLAGIKQKMISETNILLQLQYRFQSLFSSLKFTKDMLDSFMNIKFQGYETQTYMKL